MSNLSKSSAEILMKLVFMTQLNPGQDDALEIMTRIHMAKLELQSILAPAELEPEQAENLAKELVSQRKAAESEAATQAVAEDMMASAPPA